MKKPTPTHAPRVELLPAGQVADRLGIGRHVFWRWRKRLPIPCHVIPQIGTIYVWEEVLEWWNSTKTTLPEEQFKALMEKHYEGKRTFQEYLDARDKAA